MTEGKPKTNVVPLPPRRERLTEIVREIADDDGRWSIIISPEEERREWRVLVNRRQVKLCLKEGYVLDEVAKRDEHGYWRFRIARVCAGLHVTIHVALEPKGALPKLYIIGINGVDQWPPL